MLLDWLWNITGRAQYWADLYDFLVEQLEEKEAYIESMLTVMNGDQQEMQRLRRENDELKAKAAQGN